MTNTYSAANDRIIIRREKRERVGSILLPENSAQKVLSIGEILSVGPDVDAERFSAGMRVAYGEFAGAWLDKDADIFVVVADDINAIVTKG